MVPKLFYLLVSKILAKHDGVYFLRAEEVHDALLLLEELNSLVLWLIVFNDQLICSELHDVVLTPFEISIYTA